MSRSAQLKKRYCLVCCPPSDPHKLVQDALRVLASPSELRVVLYSDCGGLGARSVRAATVRFVAVAAGQLGPADVYALLLPLVAPALKHRAVTLASEQVGAARSCGCAVTGLVVAARAARRCLQHFLLQRSAY